MSTNELNTFLSSFEKPQGIAQDAWNEVIKQARNVWHAYLNGEDWNEQLDIHCKESYMMLVSKEGKLIIQNETLLHYVKNREVVAWRKHLEELAYSAIRNNKFDLAERYFTKALKLDPTNAFNFYRRGMVSARLLKNKEALADFSKAIELKPGVAVFYLKRAEIHRLLDLDYKAMADMNKAIKLDPQNPQAFEMRGKFRLSLGDRAGGNRDLLTAQQVKVEGQTSGKELYGRAA